MNTLIDAMATDERLVEELEHLARTGPAEQTLLILLYVLHEEIHASIADWRSVERDKAEALRERR